jgi:molybdopterin-guanine dinucleotide biosynthesis protein A
MTVPLLGIFVGGQSRRMGGTPKGLLRAPGSDETLIERLARVGREAGLAPMLVGAAELGAVGTTMPRVFDREPRVGPLSGLAALIDYAGSRVCIAVACDMPRVSSALLLRLVQEAPAADVHAPRDVATGKWDPLCARYTPDRVRPVLDRALARGTRSFQALFRELPVVELALTETERLELYDWDSPEDVRRS